MVEGSLEVQLPTIWTDLKQRWEKAEKKVRRERPRRDEKKHISKKRKSEKLRRKKVQVREEVGKPRNIEFVP